MLNHNTHILKWCFTYRLSVIHTLQEETVELRGLCSLYSKNIFDPDEEVVLNVSVQLPTTCSDVCSLNSCYIRYNNTFKLQELFSVNCWHVILFCLDILQYYFGHYQIIIRCTGLYIKGQVTGRGSANSSHQTKNRTTHNNCWYVFPLMQRPQ